MVRERLYALLWAVLTLAAGASAEFQVNQYTQHHQTHPAVAMNESGEFVVAWRSNPGDGRGGGVYARCFHADGTPVADEFKVNDSASDVDNWGPAVAISASDKVVVVWIGVQEGQRHILARMFDTQGSPLTDEFLVNTSPVAVAQSTPSIAMNSAGAFVVIWTNHCGMGLLARCFAAGRVYNEDGSPATEEFPVAEQAQARWPDVAMEDSGRFVVTWMRMGDTCNQPYGEYILLRLFKADGTPAGDAVCITGDLYNRWYGPSIAAGGAGQFAVTWAVGPFPHDVCTQTFDSQGSPITEPYIINDCLVGNQGRPCIASNGTGEYLAVWESEGQDGDCYGVFGQCCTGEGELHGGPLALNTFVVGRQWYPDVAMSPAGDYVVVWISQDQDGSGYGIFAETGAR